MYKILSLVLLLLLIGCESDTSSFLIIGVVEDESPGAFAGIEIGDIIISVNGSSPENWNNFNHIAETSIGKEVSLKVKRGNDTLALAMTPRNNSGQGIGSTGLSPYLMMILVEETPGPGSPSRQAGFLTKDVILNVNNKPVTSFLDIINPVKFSKGRVMEFVVKRQNAIVTLRVTPSCNAAKENCKIGLPMVGVSAEEVD